MLEREDAHDAVERALRDEAARREVGPFEGELRAQVRGRRPARRRDEPRRDVDAEHGRALPREEACDPPLAAARVEPARAADAAERPLERAIEEAGPVRITLDPADPGLRVLRPVRLQRWSISRSRSRASFASPVLGYFSISVL